MFTRFPYPLRRRWAGYLILLAMMLMALGLIGLPIPTSVAGIGYWGAAALLWSGLSKRNRTQAVILLLIGGGCLAASYGLGASISSTKLLSSNSNMLSMLVAVSFLSLVSRPSGQQQSLPSGARAVASTMGAVHLFGAIINLSAVFIIGDRLSKRNTLTREQSIVLVRSFTAAAFWSPFFGAMAITLGVVPLAKLSLLWLISMPLALLSMVLTYWQMHRQTDIEAAPISDFTGYPLHLGGIWLPSLLAAAVLIAHQGWPSLSILAVITVLAPLFTLLVLTITRRSLRSGIDQLITGRLPQMGNELVLFLAAGVLAYGLANILAITELVLPITEFGALEAALTYLATVLLSLLGIHPIVGIALAGSLLLPLDPDHTLLALVFLSAWAVGTSTGPLSGINLAFQGRYGVDSFRIMRWNLSYLAIMSILVVIGIWLLANLLGV